MLLCIYEQLLLLIYIRNKDGPWISWISFCTLFGRHGCHLPYVRIIFCSAKTSCSISPLTRTSNQWQAHPSNAWDIESDCQSYAPLESWQIYKPTGSCLTSLLSTRRLSARMSDTTTSSKRSPKYDCQLLGLSRWIVWHNLASNLVREMDSSLVKSDWPGLLELPPYRA